MNPDIRFSLVPGPTPLQPATAAVYGQPWDRSPDLEEGFFTQYAGCQSMLLDLLRAPHDASAVIASGEAMVVLWGSLKSTVRPGDTVVCLGNGIFGHGFADMARSIGANVIHIKSAWDEPLDVEALERVTERPVLVTAVHCDTPSGVLNSNMGAIGSWCRERGSLFAVDFVSSAFACDVRVQDWNIDLGLLGTQKVLSCGSDLGIVTVSARAWDVIERVKYVGYDALLPFRHAVANRHMPYSHNWRAVAALHSRLTELAQPRALTASFDAHARAASQCVQWAHTRGLELVAPLLASPSCTALYVPTGWTWPQLRDRLVEQGVVVGGSYGELANRVWRIGHMGPVQCRQLSAALPVIGDVLDAGPNAGERQ